MIYKWFITFEALFVQSNYGYQRKNRGIEQFMSKTSGSGRVGAADQFNLTVVSAEIPDVLQEENTGDGFKGEHSDVTQLNLH